MKKFVAIGLSAVLGLACLGVAACGGNGEEIDPVTFVSDRISSDEDWNRAMWNTLVALTDFDGDDDPTKTYADAPYWHPKAWDLTWPKNGNYKITIESQYTTEIGKMEFYEDGKVEIEEKEEYFIDDGKFYVHLSAQTSAMSGGVEAYGRYNADGSFSRAERRFGTQNGEEQVEEWGEHSDLLEDNFLHDLISVLDFSHLSNYPSAEQRRDVNSPYYMAYNPFYYYDAEQIAAGSAGGPIYYQSVFEFAKYDEAKGGYVISPILSGDEHLDSRFLGYFSPVIGSVLKFKDGKLVAVTNWHIGGEDPVFDLAITYGGQKVEFPSDLPW